MTINIASLFSAESFQTILDRGLEVAKVVGLPTTSWRVGDPTRTLFRFAARVLSRREDVTSEYIKSAWLSTATGPWLEILALEVYGVTKTQATYATSSVVVTNAGGGVYTIDPGDATVKNTASGKTYSNTNTVTLSGVGATATLEVTADEAGTSSNAAVNEIDALITTYTGVTVTSSTAAVAQDEQTDPELREQCSATLGALSPSGPPDAYEYVCRNSTLTGTSEITRAQSDPDGTTLAVTTYVAGASGPVSGAAVTLAQAAVEEWATPLTVTPTVANATAAPQTVTCTVSGEDMPAVAAVETAFESALGALFKALAIGGVLSHSDIVRELHETLVGLGASSVSVVVSVPAASSTLAAGYVATLGTVSVTEI